MEDQPRVNLDLDGLVARYGRALGQAHLETEIAIQRATRAEARVADLEESLEALARRVEELEGGPPTAVRVDPEEDAA